MLRSARQETQESHQAPWLLRECDQCGSCFLRPAICKWDRLSPNSTMTHIRNSHVVEITKPYYIGQFRSSQNEYETVMGLNPRMPSHRTGRDRARSGRPDTSRFPVEWVSQEEAMEFCLKLSCRPEELAAGASAVCQLRPNGRRHAAAGGTANPSRLATRFPARMRTLMGPRLMAMHPRAAIWNARPKSGPTRRTRTAFSTCMEMWQSGVWTGLMIRFTNTHRVSIHRGQLHRLIAASFAAEAGSGLPVMRGPPSALCASTLTAITRAIFAVTTSGSEWSACRRALRAPNTSRRTK